MLEQDRERPQLRQQVGDPKTPFAKSSTLSKELECGLICAVKRLLTSQPLWTLIACLWLLWLPMWNAACQSLASRLKAMYASMQPQHRRVRLSHSLLLLL